MDRSAAVEDVIEYRLDRGWRERSSRTCSHWAGWDTDRAVIKCQAGCAEGHISGWPRSARLPMCACLHEGDVRDLPGPMC